MQFLIVIGVVAIIGVEILVSQKCKMDERSLKEERVRAVRVCPCEA